MNLAVSRCHIASLLLSPTADHLQSSLDPSVIGTTSGLPILFTQKQPLRCFLRKKKRLISPQNAHRSQLGLQKSGVYFVIFPRLSRQNARMSSRSDQMDEWKNGVGLFELYCSVSAVECSSSHWGPNTSTACLSWSSFSTTNGKRFTVALVWENDCWQVVLLRKILKRFYMKP